MALLPPTQLDKPSKGTRNREVKNMPTTLFDSKVIQDAVTAQCAAPRHCTTANPGNGFDSDGQLRLFLDSSLVLETR